MQLLIDAGNTRIKWAVPGLTGTPVRGETETGKLPVWLHMNSVAHADMATLTEAWQGIPFTHVLVSNVAGDAIRAQLIALLAAVRADAKISWFSSAARLAGIQNNYRNPAQLGCDRLASMIGAHYLFPAQDLIVATCGTATTVDAVTAQGDFVGGMILPGLKLMAESLARNTAQLPQVAESTSIAEVFADNTDQAIVSGCISAQVGAILRAVTALEQRQQQQQKHQQHQQHQQQLVNCILSGGAAPYLLAHLDISYQYVDNLVLTGLFVVAQSSPS
ncbi:type III pantothenate kinase [Undibacterium sp. TJN19]|uniref:type III pantothenate kinase n=1 Tax=Undibacterium sp. TJN19 TaxID=3413055 RepID=UPI003BF14326